MSRSPLKAGSKINLFSTTVSGKVYSSEFEILEQRGSGGSSYVYMATDGSGIVTLKEFCPSSLNDDPDALTRIGTDIIVSPEHKSRFSDYLSNFENAYYLMNNYLKNNIAAALANITQTGLFEGNGTKYIRTVYEHGVSYDKIKDKDLHFMFKIILAVAKAVRFYHRSGYLVLDIKPENVLILKNADEYITEFVKFFDFDSITTFENALSADRRHLVTPGFAPPETRLRLAGKIDVRSDIYEIGVMTYLRLTGKMPVAANSFSRSELKVDNSCKLLRDASPALIREINIFLNHTMQSLQSRRYSSVDEVISHLEKLVAKTRPEQVSLLDKRKKPTDDFVGRSDECTEMKRRLDTDGVVFLHSLPGVGKTELTKKFVQKYSDSFSTVQFASFRADMRETIASLDFLNFNENDYGGKIDDLYNAKLRLLQKCDEGTLIIIDEYTSFHDPHIDEAVYSNNANVKFIFTTPGEVYGYKKQTMNLSPLCDEDCKLLFFNLLDPAARELAEEDDSIDLLLSTLQKNTLLIRLVADVINSSFGEYDIKYICNIFQNAKFEKIDIPIFSAYECVDNSDSEIQTIMQHLCKMFRIKKLDEYRFHVLNNLSLVPRMGIKIPELMKNSGFSSEHRKALRELSSGGWIEIEPDYSVTLNPLLADVIAAIYSHQDDFAEYDEYKNLIGYIAGYISDDSDMSIAAQQKQLVCAIDFKRRCLAYFNEEELFNIDITIGRLNHSLCRYDEALICFSSALKSLEMLNKDNDMSFVSLYLRMYRSALASGRYTDAEKYIENSIFHAWKYNDNKNSDKKISVNALRIYYGELYDLIGHYDEAIEIYNSVLDDSNTCFEGENPMIPNALFHIANSLSDKGDPVAASEYFEKELRYAEEYPGENRINVGVTLAEIAENQFAAGNYMDSIEKYEEAYRIFCIHYGAEHPKTKNIRYAVAGALSCAGNNDRALRYAEDNVEFAFSQYGENSVQAAYAFKIYSEILLQCGNLIAAGAAIEKAVNIYSSKNFPISQPDYATALMNKAEYLYTSGQINDAKLILYSLSRIKMESSLDKATFYANYASILTIIGDLGKAEEVCREYIMLVSRYSLSDQHMINAYMLLGNVYLRMRKLHDAISCYENCICIIGDPASNEMAMLNYGICLGNSGAVYIEMGFFEKAQPLISKCLDILEAQYPNGHQRLTDVYINMGKCLAAQGKIDDAQSAYDKAEKMMNTLGMTDERKIVLFANKALLYGKKGDYCTAIDLCEKSLKLQSEIEIPSNPQIAEVMGNTGLFYVLSGENEKGEKLITEAIEMLDSFDDKNTFFVEAAEMYGNLSLSALIRKNYESAVNFAKQAVELLSKKEGIADIRNVDIYLRLADAYIVVGNAESSQESLLKAMSVCADIQADGLGSFVKLPMKEIYMLLSELRAQLGDKIGSEYFLSTARAVDNEFTR